MNSKTCKTVKVNNGKRPKSSGIWWKDTLLNLKMDLKNNIPMKKWNKIVEDLVELSNIRSTCPMGELFEKRCPSSWMVMIQGETFDVILDFYNDCGLEDMNLSIFNNLQASLQCGRAIDILGNSQHRRCASMLICALIDDSVKTLERMHGDVFPSEMYDGMNKLITVESTYGNLSVMTKPAESFREHLMMLAGLSENTKDLRDAILRMVEQPTSS